MRKKDAQIEKAMRKLAEYDVRKKIMTDDFTNFVRHHSVWMRELVRKYKEMNSFPILPTMISEYYGNRRDKEVALLMTLCMNWKGDVYRQIQSVMDIIGEQPYLWFRNGEYRLLSLPKNQKKHLDGYNFGNYLKISYFVDHLYHLCNDVSGFRGFEDVFADEPFVDTMVGICNDAGLAFPDYKARVVYMVLHTSDGIGLGLWEKTSKGDPEPLCPCNDELMRFLKMWVPSFRSSGFGKAVFTFDEAVRLLGLERDVDFFYSYYAWKELSRRKPKECKKYMHRYQSLYNVGAFMKPAQWRYLFPEIVF